MTSSPLAVSSDSDQPPVRFEPLRPASRGQVIAALVLGPILWLVALIVAAWTFKYSWAIQLGFAVTAASFLLALLVLALVRRGRRRQEMRYADRS